MTHLSNKQLIYVTGVMLLTFVLIVAYQHIHA